MKKAPWEGAYRLLLRAHPRAFRRRWEADLVACYRAQWRDEVADRGVRAAAAFAWRTLQGTVATAWHQRAQAAPAAWSGTDMGRPVMRGFGGWLDAMLQDGRYAGRMLRRSPGFAVAVLGTLGLGIGAATAVFTMVDGVLLQPLPYPGADRLYTVSQDGEDGSYWLSAPNYDDLKRELAGVESMGAYSPDGANVMVDGEPARVSVAEADAGFFRTLGVEPVLGRTFTEQEQRAGAAVAVISWGMWQQRMGGRRDAVGSTVTLDGAARDVIGVLPAGLMVPAGTDVWTPLVLDRPDWRTRRGISWIKVLARLEPDADVTAVRARAATLSVTMRELYPDVNSSFEVGLRSLEEATVGPMRAQLGMLMAAVVLMLLVAAINVGGLLLARGTVRREELAVRMALGGGPRRLVAQLFTEHAVLACAGVFAGLVIGRLGVALLVAAAPPGTPRLNEVALGGNGALFAALAGMAAALLFGLLPAFAAARGTAAILRSSRSGGARASMRLRDALVVAQVALALALLFGAGLLARSFWQLQQVDLGFEADRVLVAGLPVGDDFPSAEAHAAHYRNLLERAADLPGVQSAALTNSAPFSSFGVVFSYELPDVPEATGVEKLCRFRIATPELFETLRIPIVRGRTFAPLTAASRAYEAVVSEELAQRWFAGRDPVGSVIATAGDTFRIVGVAGAIRDVTAREASPFPHVYVPVMPSTRQSLTLVLRATGEAESVVDPLRRAIREAAPAQPITPLRPLRELIADSAARDRFTLVLLAFFAAAALLLAGVGLYGVLAYAVSRRTREIGVRVALGAPAARVQAMVVRRGLALVLLGLTAGGVLALWGGRFLEGMLFQVDARDPLVLSAVLATLLAVALLAAWIPARRATRIAPVEALRTE